MRSPSTNVQLTVGLAMLELVCCELRGFALPALTHTPKTSSRYRTPTPALLTATTAVPATSRAASNVLIVINEDMRED